LKEIPYYKVKIKDDFWDHWMKVNSEVSVFHQLEELEKDHHINNFRVAAGLKNGIHQGEFYYDSDLYKWLEGACYILKNYEGNRNFDDLKQKVKEIADFIEKSQLCDGYLNTFYSTKFLNKRFTNILIFHELYCVGHLIEAAIAYELVFKDNKLLRVAEKFADLIINKFKDTQLAPGHQEIELALIKLGKSLKKKEYIDLAKLFIDNRGRIPHYKTYALQSILDMQKTLDKSKELSLKFQEKPADSEVAEFFQNLSLLDNLELLKQNLNGKMYQLNKPIVEAYKPVGHAVRAMYFYCGIADLFRETNDEKYLKCLQLLWLKMVKARMYITGGTGSQKAIEGFEGDFEHSPESSYSETCAAIGNIMWNWRLLKATNKVKYADLIEKLLYNAMLVGQSLDGKRYFYYNPLQSNGKHKRQEWFKCPCCPTNVIRTIPTIGKYIYTKLNKQIWIHQYIGNETEIKLDDDLNIRLVMKSKFPWKGDCEITIITPEAKKFALLLRIPPWSKMNEIKVNSEEILNSKMQQGYYKIDKTWKNNDIIKIHFDMHPEFVRNDPRIKGTRNKIALKNGPIIYCLEEKDNSNFNFEDIRISDDQNLEIEFKKDFLNGINIIKGKTNSGGKIIAIPYYAWGNRGSNRMKVWINRK